jgi:cytochrome oxidase Cu insertion factor (SCO1/SenC/PrrC family)
VFYPQRTMRRGLVGQIGALLAWGAAVTVALAAQGLGPKDGVGLPPTDLGRVAVGSPAPDFTLESKDGETVTLSSFRDRKNVVLVFYRGQW